jgi:hypothetical protein
VNARLHRTAREALDESRAGAIRTALPAGELPLRDRTLGNWLEALRDRVVVRSQVGKRKLDAALTRRQLDRKLVVLGERFLRMVREGRLAAPRDVADLVEEARELEERLETQQQDIAALESEAV